MRWVRIVLSFELLVRSSGPLPSWEAFLEQPLAANLNGFPMPHDDAIEIPCPNPIQRFVQRLRVRNDESKDSRRTKFSPRTVKLQERSRPTRSRAARKVKRQICEDQSPAWSVKKGKLIRPRDPSERREVNHLFPIGEGGCRKFSRGGPTRIIVYDAGRHDDSSIFVRHEPFSNERVVEPARNDDIAYWSESRDLVRDLRRVLNWRMNPEGTTW